MLKETVNPLLWCTKKTPNNIHNKLRAITIPTILNDTTKNNKSYLVLSIPMDLAPMDVQKLLGCNPVRRYLRYVGYK